LLLTFSDTFAVLYRGAFFKKFPEEKGIKPKIPKDEA
jgi:hypothetical protein